MRKIVALKFTKSARTNFEPLDTDQTKIVIFHKTKMI